MTTVNCLLSQPLYVNPFIGESGQVTIPLNLPFRAMEVTEIDDGYLVCGRGRIEFGDISGFYVEMLPKIFKVNKCGELDSSYGINGQAEVNSFLYNNLYQPYYTPYDYEVLSDGSVIIAGDLNTKPILMKIDNSGFIDSTFNNPLINNYIELENDTLGKCIRIDASNDNSYKCLFALDDNNTYLNIYSSKLALISINQQGELDSTFGNNGIYIHNLTNNSMRIESTLKNNEDGYFISAVLDPTNNNANYLEIIKIKDDLTLDSSFNESGLLVDTTYNITNAENTKHSIYLNHFNNNLLISSINDLYLNAKIRFELIDLNGNSVNSFGTNGKLEILLNYNVGGLLSVSEINNNIFASYSCNCVALDTSFVMKIELDGQLSSTFNNGQALNFNHGNIHIGRIIENENEILFVGGQSTNAYLNYLIYEDINPMLTFEGNYLFSNINSNNLLQFKWYLNGEEIIDSQDSSIEILLPGEYVVTVSDIENCRILSDTINLTSVDIVSHHLNEYSVYPVPAKDILNIKSIETINNIEVFDYLGRLVYAKTNESDIINISLSNLDAGIYFLKINDMNKKRFVVIK